MAQESRQVKRTIAFSTKRSGEVHYVLTAADFLDLARAVEYEGPPKLGVAWTLIQRFAYLYPVYPTLSKFVKAYSQPVNPRWFPSGVEHTAYYAMLRSKGDEAGAQRENIEAANRVVKASAPLSALHKDTFQAIDTVFTQHYSPIPKSLHFHAPDLHRTQDVFAKNKGLDVVTYGTGVRQNWFFGIANTTVSVIATLEDSAAIGSALIALGYIGGILYLIKRLYAQ